MKKIIFTLCFIAFLSADKIFAQGYLEAAGKPYVTEGVIEFSGNAQKDKLYTLGGQWLANLYNETQPSIQFQDKDNNVIIAKALLTPVMDLGLNGLRVNTLNYNISLSFKDGKIRYRLYNYFAQGYGLIKDGEVTRVMAVPHGYHQKIYTYYQSAIIDNNKFLVDDLTAFVKAGLADKNDW